MWCPVHRFWLAGCLALPLCLAAGSAWAQFDDTFNSDPFASGDWISNSNWGGPSWVEQGSPLCDDPNVFDPNGPCTVDEDYDGYVLVTDPAGNRGGNFFRADPDNYDNFKLTVEVELRDGGTALGRPADGMVVVVVGGDVPPGRLGSLGGGMAAPCTGGDGTGVDDNTLPQFAWEFDNWSCNTGDAGPDNPGVSGDAGGYPDSQWHHVAFSYSGTGFPCTDAIPPQVWFPFRKSEVPLHNQQPPQAPKNRFLMTVYAQKCGTTLTVACDLNAIDQGKDLGRLYTFQVPDFEPFAGYLGVTASTGGAWQNHILHSAKLEALPPGFCLVPTADTARDITIRNPNENICGDYEVGTIADVALTLSNVRQASECCAAATAARVVETVPANWTISGISPPGSAVGQTITWNLTGANLVEGKVLSYTATAAAGATGAASFSGSTDDGAGGTPVATRGDSRLNPHAPFDTCGRIKCWNVLSALGQNGGNNPGVDNQRLDYLSDGSQTELDFEWAPGAEITPEFGGSAASTFVFEDPNGRAPNALSGIATVSKYVSPDGWVDLNNAVFGGNPDNVMAYAQIYVISQTTQDVFIACDSDDGIQVILNEEEVWNNSVPRGNDAQCPPPLGSPRGRLRDVTPTPVTLNQGENRLIVKTFEGGGDFNFELRFEGANTKPITNGLSLSHTPSTPTCRVPPAVVTRAIDTRRTVGSQDAWSSADIGGAPYDVSLTLSDIRQAAGLCTAAGNVTIVDTVPEGWVASNASAGGSVNGREVTWAGIAASNGLVLSYKVAPGGDTLGEVFFAGAVTEAGNPSSFGARGERRVLYQPPLLARGAAEDFAADDFENDDGNCPDGWTCNTGSGAFTPAGNAEGRLQLSCATDNASCGNGATAAIWSEPIDLSNTSFKAEFDVFMSHPGAAVVGNPPADALTMVVADADTYTDPTTVIGTGGGCNGYCNLTRSFAVEFDLWNNGPEPSGYNSPGIDFVHVALIRDGSIFPHVQTHLDLLGPDATPTRLGGAGWPEFVDFSGGTGIPLHFEVDYNNGTIQVYLTAPDTAGPAGEPEAAFPRTKVLDSIVTFPPLIPLGGGGGGAAQEPVLQNAWIGFTDGTGGAIFAGAVDNFVVTSYPGAPPEICNNTVDDDGDGKIDCADDDCAAFPACLAPQFFRGDADNNGTLQLTDAIRVLGFLFLGGPPPSCMDAGDADGNNTLQLTDAIRILGFLFLGGPPPASPGPPGGGNVCGPDNDAISLGCALYDKC